MIESFMSPICPLCSSTDARPAFTKNGFDHFDCRHCRALYVSPRPRVDEIASFYRRDKGDAISNVCWSEDGSSHRHWRDTWRAILKDVETRAGRGPLLDLGCGTGQFLAFAHDEGWDELAGIELVPEAAARARERVPEPTAIHEGDLTEIALPANHFSVAFLWDVIEHAADVGALLSSVHGLLRPGGIAVFGTVHRSGVSLRARGERALTVSPPEHLTFFTRAGMSEAVTSVGFELVRCWSETIYLREWTRTQADAEYTAWRSGATSGPLFRAAMKLANAGLRLANLGDELIAVARRVP